MNANKLFLLLLLSLVSILTVQAQGTCGTPTNSLNRMPTVELNTYETSACSYTLRVYVHVVRRSDGTGGISATTVNQSLDILDEHFNDHNIFFSWDNNIDYIDSNTYYNTTEYNNTPTEIGITAIFSENRHDDGIDIYFLEETNVMLGDVFVAGASNGLGESSEYFVSGNNILTSNMSHEMGHVLNLFHTHHSCETGDWEYTDRSNCEEAGDFICDTQSDPRLDIVSVNGSFSLGIPPCGWDESKFIYVNPNNNTYVCAAHNIPEDINNLNPDTRNIMSYAPAACREHFSPGQGKRMRCSIASFPFLKQTLVQDALTFDYTTHSIHNNTNWTTSNTPNNGNINIKNELVIENGATLTIKEGVTVSFPQKGKIIIKPNGTLILEGKLTSSECNNFWKGVEVWGDSFKSQEVQGGKRYQGRLVCKDGSVIENAEIAAQLWGPDKVQNAGGQISCYKATFINNKIGVEFAPFENTYPFSFPIGWMGQTRNYYATFNEVTFKRNNSYQIDEQFHSFIHMTDVRGIRIDGCSFTNEQNAGGQSIVDFGYGIFANDSGFKVGSECRGYGSYPNAPTNCSPSTFKGLGYGVYATNIYKQKPFTVQESEFTQCFVGVYNNMVTGSTIASNKFELTVAPNTTVSDTPTIPNTKFGVVIENNISGITFQGNEFTVEGDPTANTIGTFSKDLGTFNNLISGNTFDDFDIANLANGWNSGFSLERGDEGLHYLCNDSENSLGYDFASQGKGIRLNQGFLVLDFNTGVITYDAAGNKFAYTGLPEDRDFSTGSPNGGGLLNYHYFDNGRQIPISTSANIDEIESEENICPESNCIPPCKTPIEVQALKADFYTYQNALNGLSDVLGNDNKSNELDRNQLLANYYRQEMDRSSQIIVTHLLLDTITRPDTLITWLENIDNFGMDMQLAVMYQMNGEWGKAQKYVNRASQREDLGIEQETDLKIINDLFNIVKNKSPYQLNENTFRDLEDLSTHKNNIIGNIAKSILTYYGYHFPIEYELPEKQGKSGKLNLNTDPFNEDKALLIYPNPSQGMFIVEWSPKEINQITAELVITDITGNIIEQVSLNANSQSNIDLSKESKGIYLYQFINDKGLMRTGKLVVY